MRNWKAILPIALSLVIAAAGTYYIYQWTQRQTATQEVVMAEVEATPVAVATVDLPWGTKITGEMAKTSPFLKESVPVGHFSSVDSLKGRVLIDSLKKGDPIVEHRLAPIDVTAFLSASCDFMCRRPARSSPPPTPRDPAHAPRMLWPHRG